MVTHSQPSLRENPPHGVAQCGSVWLLCGGEQTSGRFYNRQRDSVRELIGLIPAGEPPYYYFHHAGPDHRLCVCNSIRESEGS